MSSYGYYVERQPWTHWPKVLIMRHRTGQVPDETLRYVPERTCDVEGYDDGVDEGMDGEWYSYAPPTWYLSCGHRCEGSERPRYCPRCGKQVVEVDE
jgi:hypothetical protein